MNFIDLLEKTANVLTSKSRKKISDEDFALPGRKYPIENLAHARNALARVSQFGTPEEQATVRAKVHAKYPELKKTATDWAGIGRNVTSVAGKALKGAGSWAKANPNKAMGATALLGAASYGAASPDRKEKMKQDSAYLYGGSFK